MVAIHPRRTVFLVIGVLSALCGLAAGGYRRFDLDPASRWPRWDDEGWDTQPPKYRSDLAVNWLAPYFSGTGVSSEASLMALGTEQFLGTRLVIDQHGDKTSYRFVNGVVRKRHKELTRFSARSAGAASSTIYVCHSDPDAWHPKPKRLPGNACPKGGALYTIGRTHTETDSLPMDWARKMNRMDEIWVPTEHHRDIFVKSGVLGAKIVVVPQPADLELFNPEKVKPMPLPGSKGDHKDSFKFLSVMDWTHRKGWDLLLRGYLSTFYYNEPVVLYVLTSKYKTTAELLEFLDRELDVDSLEYLPRVEVVPYVRQKNMPRLYKSVDAFVLPTRSEGWGRTITEAMCMELPVIATKYSGPAAYLTEENSYPLRIDGMRSVPDGELAGQMMAEPDLDQLRQHLRDVVSYRWTDAARRGKQARRDMHKFSKRRVGRFVAHHLAHIARNLDGELADL